MEFDQIYDEIVSYEKIDQKSKQIECHGTPIEKKKRKFQKEMLSEIRKGINLYDIRQLELFD